jgi:hypothetical protein
MIPNGNVIEDRLCLECIGRVDQQGGNRTPDERRIMGL